VRINKLSKKKEIKIRKGRKAMKQEGIEVIENNFRSRTSKMLNIEVNCAFLLGCMVYKYTDLGNLTILTGNKNKNLGLENEVKREPT
jgi:hypothetical protein